MSSLIICANMCQQMRHPNRPPKYKQEIGWLDIFSRDVGRDERAGGPGQPRLAERARWVSAQLGGWGCWAMECQGTHKSLDGGGCGVEESRKDEPQHCNISLKSHLCWMLLRKHCRDELPVWSEICCCTNVTRPSAFKGACYLDLCFL